MKFKYDLKKRAKTFLTKSYVKKAIGLFAILFIIGCILYHNDTCYTVFRDKINPRVINYLGIDLLTGMNRFAHSLDIIGKVKSLQNPLKESDFMDIEIDEFEQTKLDEYRECSPIVKKWVGIQIKINGEYQPAKLKFHGSHPVHYQGNNSYTIKLNTGYDYLDKMRRFKLIKGEDASPLMIAVNQIASDMGLIATVGKLIVLRINDKKIGHYYFVEDIKMEYLEREFGITNYAILANVQDVTRKGSSSGIMHISHFDLYFGHLEKKKLRLNPKALSVYEKMAERVKNKDIQGLKEFFDEDYIARYLALASIFNEVQFMTGDNLKFIYDFNRGKFYPIYRMEGMGIPVDPFLKDMNGSRIGNSPNFNKILFNSEITYRNSVNTRIFKMLLADDDIRNKRNQYLQKFILNKQGLYESLNKTYEENEHILLNSGVGRRPNEINRKDQVSIVNTTLELAYSHLNYALIYGSYDSLNHKLYLMPDVFSSINLIHIQSGFKKENIMGIGFDDKLNFSYNYLTFNISQDSFNLKELLFINAITNDTISVQHIHINYIDKSDSIKEYSTIQMLKSNGVGFLERNDSLLIQPGSYAIKSDVIISSNYLTLFQKGTTLNISEKVNFMVLGDLIIDGKKNNKVVVRSLNKDAPFGTFSVIGKDSSSSVDINYLEVDGGNESSILGFEFTGQFAIYNCNVTIKNSIFKNSNSDDGINIKYSHVEIYNCKFINNKSDQVDLDFCVGTVTNCTFYPSFINANGDGLDVSGSYVAISECVFSKFEDKGLSLGEGSKVLIYSNKFIENEVAITVKDETKAYSWSNLFESNQMDYSLFIKKKYFGIPELFSPDKLDPLTVDNIQGVLINLSKEDIKIELERFTIKNKKYKVQSHLKKLVPSGLM